MSLAIRPISRSAPPPVKVPEPLRKAGMGPPPQPLDESVIERLVKLVPADVVALYVPALGFEPLTAWPRYRLAVSIAGTMLVPLLLFLDARSAGDRVPLVQYVVRTLAFVAWALVIGEPFGHGAIPQVVPALIALVLPVIGERLLRMLPPS